MIKKWEKEKESKQKQNNVIYKWHAMRGKRNDRGMKSKKQ